MVVRGLDVGGGECRHGAAEQRGCAGGERGRAGPCIEDVGFEAGDASEAGGSSVAGFVSGAQGVVMRRVRLSAGKGKAGSPVGTTGSNYSGAAPNGGVPNGANGGPEAVNHCVNGTTSTGGKGGSGAADAGTTKGDGGGGVQRGRLRVGMRAREALRGVP